MPDTRHVSPRTQYARSGSVNVAYQTVGEGSLDLVLAPGFISHLDLQWTVPGFASWIEALAGLGRVILFDKRGTGLSDPAPDADRFDLRMDDIRAVMDAAGSDRALLVGVSEGGPLAALFAAAHPERVQALVLYGTFARGANISPAVLERFRYAVANWGDGLTADIFVAPQNIGPLVRRFTGLLERASASPGLATALLDSIASCDVTRALPIVSAPTLVVHRRDDPFAAREWSEELVRLVPGARLVELEGDAHIPWLGDVDDLVGAVEEFVTGERTSRARDVCVLGTFLLTDIFESTARAVALGDARWGGVLAEHNAIVRDRLARHGGRELNHTGDGFLAHFATPGGAISCALDIVGAVRDAGLEIRAGLHSGECQDLGADGLVGLAVHLAARVCARAGPGEVLITSVTRQLAVGGGFRFRSTGRHTLKGFPGPVEVFAVLTDDAGSAADDVERRYRAFDRVSLGVAQRAPGVVRALSGLTRVRA